MQSELHATKSHAQSLDQKNIKARVENALLKVGGWVGRLAGGRVWRQCWAGCLVPAAAGTGGGL